MKKAISGGILLLLAVYGVYLAYRGAASLPVQTSSRFIMDTYCTITVPGGDESLPAITAAFDRMEEVDRKFNAHNDESPVALFNRQGGSLEDPEVVAMVRVAQDISERSGGAFDITVGPLLRLWGFYTGEKRVPAPSEIAAVLERLGYRYLELDATGLRKQRTDVEIDLGGIAKGYAISEAVRALDERGITSALIDAGGDIYTRGTVRGRPWKIGIRDPGKQGILGILHLSDLAVATSGDYERFFERDGVRYHHLLDPATGYPAEGMRSVTVVCEDPMLADAWATCLFVLGMERGLKLAEEVPGVEACMVSAENTLTCTTGLQGMLQIKQR